MGWHWGSSWRQQPPLWGTGRRRVVCHCLRSPWISSAPAATRGRGLLRTEGESAPSYLVNGTSMLQLMLCSVVTITCFPSPSCIAIGFLVEKMPLKWILSHQLCFAMALMFVLLDLTGEVSAGTIKRAKQLMDKLLIRCNTPLPDDLKVQELWETGKQESILFPSPPSLTHFPASHLFLLHHYLSSVLPSPSPKSSLTAAQEKSFHQVTRHLVKEVISPNENVRKQVPHIVHACTLYVYILNDCIIIETEHCEAEDDRFSPPTVPQKP